MWWAKSVAQPSPDVSMGEYQLINHKIKFPGIVTWNDIDIVLVNIPTGDVSLPTKGQELIDILRANGYKPNPPLSGEDGLIKRVFSRKDILITKIDADGETIETWKLINPFIKSIKYGDLDYSSDDLLEITITVAYDSATLT
tara:strand:- start:1306 stop:1731 length:426 start_codon:yes stop_codon:yes gene_type:complete